MRSFGVWACLTLLCLGVAASCGSSSEKQVVAGGGDDQGGAGGDRDPSGGRAGGAGKGGSAGSVATAGTAGSLTSGGDAGGGGVASSGGAEGNAAGEGNASGQGGAAGQGGSDAVAGAGGAGGAGCCSTSAYQSSSQLLPTAVCSGWELVNNANTEVPQLLGGYLRLSTSTVAENQYYRVVSDALTVPAKLVIEARMQLISGSASTVYRAPANFSFILNKLTNSLMIGNGEIFILSAENTKGAAAAVATTDGFHVYRMEVDTALGNVEVFYDGVSKLTGKAFAGAAASLNSFYFYFGDGSIYGTSVSDWAYVTHNVDTCAD